MPPPRPQKPLEAGKWLLAKPHKFPSAWTLPEDSFRALVPDPRQGAVSGCGGSCADTSSKLCLPWPWWPLGAAHDAWDLGAEIAREALHFGSNFKKREKIAQNSLRSPHPWRNSAEPGWLGLNPSSAVTARSKAGYLALWAVLSVPVNWA